MLYTTDFRNVLNVLNVLWSILWMSESMVYCIYLTNHSNTNIVFLKYCIYSNYNFNFERLYYKENVCRPLELGKPSIKRGLNLNLLTFISIDTVIYWHCYLLTFIYIDTVIYWHCYLLTFISIDTVIYWHCYLLTFIYIDTVI